MAAPMGLLVIGSEIAGFAVAGIALDWFMGTLKLFPWATVILSPLGLVVAFWHLKQIVRPPQSGD
jgi:hypothetical protein